MTTITIIQIYAESAYRWTRGKKARQLPELSRGTQHEKLCGQAMPALPAPYRLSGIYRWIVVAVTGLTSSWAVYAGLRGM